jgi:TPR repeat protein
VGWYTQAAAAGNAQAQLALGRIYSAGDLTRADPLRAVAHYQQAAEQGEAAALTELGLLLQSDLGPAVTACFTRAAMQGDAQAQFSLAQRLERGSGGDKASPKDLPKAFVWYEKAALQGLPAAMSAVGVAYLRGLGAPCDAKRALAWLQKGADLGDARAQWNLGAMYASGAEGVARDLKLAFAWCQRSAEQGFAAAQSNLGALYALADNPARAAVCWQQAANQGDPEALYNLALAYSKGKGVAQDAAQAFSLLLQAAQCGLAPAQARLGLMYATGEGVVQDPVEAHKWFAIAASLGDEAAKANLARSEVLNSALVVAEGRRRAADTKNSRIS